MTAFLVGLTGPIGAGKSTVRALLEEHGARVIDADQLAREERRPGTLGFDEIVRRFGRDILGADGTIDPRRLAAIVFADPAQLAVLEGILHPRVTERVREVRDALADSEILVLENAKLIDGHEGKLKDACDRIWVVLAPRDTLVERAVGRDMTAEQVTARLASQPTEAAYRDAATTVIENSGDRAALARSVDEAWARVQAEARLRAPRS